LFDVIVFIWSRQSTTAIVVKKKAKSSVNLQVYYCSLEETSHAWKIAEP